MAANHRYLYTAEKLRDRLEQLASSYGGRAWDDNEISDLEASKEAKRVIFNPYTDIKPCKKLKSSDDGVDIERLEEVNEKYLIKQYTSVRLEAENNNIDADPDYPPNSKILTHYTLSLCVRMPIDCVMEIPKLHQKQIKASLNYDTLTDEDLINDRLYQSQTISYMYTPYTNSVNIRQEVTIVDDDDVEIASGVEFDSRELERPKANIRPDGSDLAKEIATLYSQEESLANCASDIATPATAEQIFTDESFQETVDAEFAQPRPGPHPQHYYIKQMFHLIAALEDNKQWAKVID